MELSWADAATLAAIVVAGPWGLVLLVALLRGYSISLRIRRRRQREQLPGEAPDQTSDSQSGEQ